MKAKDIMTTELITVHPDLSIRQLIKLMLEKSISGVPVVDEFNNLVGIISEKDIIKAVERLIKIKVSLDEQKEWQGGFNWVEGIMTKKVITVDEEDPVEKVCQVMSEHRIHRVPVMRGNKIVGIISTMNILKMIANSAKE